MLPMRRKHADHCLREPESVAGYDKFVTTRIEHLKNNLSKVYFCC
uniref:Uncharacterized protein n=1 Tax=Rhizobium rhizogenes TaxID=359 RepID=A0A4P8DKA2_RHIRH|nr:hypothetical protein pOC-C5.8_641 [Rhizobium rhizogenes]